MKPFEEMTPEEREQALAAFSRAFEQVARTVQPMVTAMAEWLNGALETLRPTLELLARIAEDERRPYLASQYRAAADSAAAAELCPAGCGCQLGTEDADRMGCGCKGPCTRMCRENGYPNAPSWRSMPWAAEAWMVKP